MIFSKACECSSTELECKEPGTKNEDKRQQFIARAIDKHGDRYSYDRVNYSGLYGKVEIVCRLHGPFWQRPDHHLAGHEGCKECLSTLTRSRLSVSFLEKFIDVHGDRYIYGAIDHSTGEAVAEIICRVGEHGTFFQKASQHLRGKGCPKCGDIIKRKNLYAEHARRKKTAANEFASKAIKVHGDKYDYSKSEYAGADEKVEIICTVEGHGSFWQRAVSHIRGVGCPKCGVNSRAQKKKITQEQFVSRAKIVHGYRYQYEHSVYKGCEEYVDIFCPVDGHGLFSQTGGSHLNGTGCPKCGYERSAESCRSTTSEFIQKAEAVHGVRYDYSKSVYVGVFDLVTIICREHGEFEQTADCHLGGSGCQKCGLNKRADAKRLSTHEFVCLAREKHGDTYDYSKVQYLRSNKAVIIVCKIHGEFSQRPNTHLNGCGCPVCGKRQSRGVRQIRRLLDSKGIAYEMEAMFPWATYKKPLRYDFHVPSMRVLIEFDGWQHYRPVEYYGGQKYFAETQKRDAIKTKSAALNGYHLIRILYDDDIETVLDKGLKKAAEKIKSGGQELPLLSLAA